MLILGFVRAPDVRILERIEEGLRRRQRIRCPLCQWQPAGHDRWSCSPGCGHVWNTFQTHGMCPGCSKQWTHTACLRCDAWPPHEDWYEDEEA